MENLLHCTSRRQWTQFDMRKWQIILLTLILSLECVAAEGRIRGESRFKVSNNRARGTVSTPGHGKFPRVYNCQTAHHYKLGPDRITRIPILIRKCPTLYQNTWFEVREDWGTETNVVADPPNVVLKHDSYWYAQRVGYFWLDPGYENPTVNMIIEGSGRVVGRATLHAAKVTFDPGVGREGELDSIDCSLDQIFKPYVRTLPHYDPAQPQPSCSYIYLISTKTSTYHPRLKVYWEIKSAQINDMAAGNVNFDVTGAGYLESSSDPVNLRVEEIQSIVTCISTTTTACQ